MVLPNHQKTLYEIYPTSQKPQSELALNKKIHQEMNLADFLFMKETI
jgi:hypothetical protein